MLAQLFIKNIAVIQKATIDFTNGLNIFTGETGAGKTILISAINGILGKRISKDIIRTGEKSAFISAVFINLPKEVINKITQLGYETEDDTLLISREINVDSKSICKINGRPATLQILKEITTNIMDLHGQNDNSFLMDRDNHILFIDNYANIDDMLNKYKVDFAHVIKIKRQIEKIRLNEQEKSQRIDMLKYQINEIKSANIIIGELDELKEKRDIISNSEKICQALGESKNIIDGNDEVSGIMDMVSTLNSNISELSEYMEEFSPYSQKLDDVYYELQELSSDISNTLSDIDYNEFELNKIENRISLITNLLNKYGNSDEIVLEHLETCEEELDDIECSDEKIQSLTEKLDKELSTLRKRADEITEIRLRCAKQFLEKVKGELVFLNMPNVELSIKHEKTKLRSNGHDDIEFLISTNIGEPPKQMAKIASGGELSRIMLSIKNVFASQDKILTSIFDEIDSGVSGAAAQKIGEKLKEVSCNRQIICVTHLAQVAMFADNHLLIKKNINDNRTYTTITNLSGNSRIEEIARITSGDVITDISLEGAKQLLDYANNISLTK